MEGVGSGSRGSGAGVKADVGAGDEASVAGVQRFCAVEYGGDVSRIGDVCSIVSDDWVAHSDDLVFISEKETFEGDSCEDLVDGSQSVLDEFHSGGTANGGGKRAVFDRILVRWGGRVVEGSREVAEEVLGTKDAMAAEGV